MSRLTPIYTFYGLLYTTFSLVGATPARPACWEHWSECIAGFMLLFDRGQQGRFEILGKMVALRRTLCSITPEPQVSEMNGVGELPDTSGNGERKKNGVGE